MPSQSPELEIDVQCLLGRCMLRVQKYEQLMKAMLAHQQVAGTVETLAAQQASRADGLADKSLGTLVKALFDSCVVVDGDVQRELLDVRKIPTDRISMAFQFSIAMTAERRAEAKTAIGDLVTMRNDLVHHFLERFDLSDDGGCKAAIHHLNQCHVRIDRHYAELRGWAQSMERAKALSAAVIQSDVFNDLIVNGIAPDGTFAWPQTGIVRILQEGLNLVGVDAWAALDAVRTWAAEHHPEQTPEKYQCRTWPQVIHESGLFDLQYRIENSGVKKAWYRERSSRVDNGLQR